MIVVQKLAIRISFVNSHFLNKDCKAKKIMNSTKFKIHLIKIYDEIELCLTKKLSIQETIERLQTLGIRLNYFKCVAPNFRTIDYNGCLKKRNEEFTASLIFIQNMIVLHLLNLLED